MTLTLFSLSSPRSSLKLLNNVELGTVGRDGNLQDRVAHLLIVLLLCASASEYVRAAGQVFRLASSWFASLVRRDMSAECGACMYVITLTPEPLWANILTKTSIYMQRTKSHVLEYRVSRDKKGAQPAPAAAAIITRACVWHALVHLDMGADAKVNKGTVIFTATSCSAQQYRQHFGIMRSSLRGSRQIARFLSQVSRCLSLGWFLLSSTALYRAQYHIIYLLHVLKFF